MDPVKAIKKKIEYNKSQDRRYRDYWYSCKVDELSIMIESGRGETVSGNMFALLKELREMEKRGGSVSVTWYYTPDDIDMNDDIMDYMVDTGLKINLTPFEDV